jgi:hypothetical protein
MKIAENETLHNWRQILASIFENIDWFENALKLARLFGQTKGMSGKWETK